MAMTAVMCLALNIFFEARSESLEGQLMIAEVTLNRVNSNQFPNTICEVVWQDKQFSWTHDGIHDDPTRMNYVDRVAWHEIQILANQILDQPNILLNTGATHYHAYYVEPYWADELTLLGQVDSHIFYE